MDENIEPDAQTAALDDEANAAPRRKGRLGSFSDERFYSNETWNRLADLLEASPGATFGIAGPRGAGKTWLMRKACAWAEAHGGLGVWFPSPSEYEPFTFVTELSDVVALGYQQYFDQRSRRVTRATRLRYGALALVGVTLALLGAGIVTSATTEIDMTFYLPIVAGVLLILAGLALYFLASINLISAQRGEGRVRDQATELRRQIRYTTTVREGKGIEAGAANTGIQAAMRRTLDRELIERPVTLSSLTQNFRSFASSIPSATNRPLVVAIDELDKLSDSQRGAQLLRDIKAIFDSDRVHFLVSLSDEAARQLDLGSIRGRNEFNSSFQVVLQIPPLNPEQGEHLLASLGSHIDRATSCSLTVLAGGLPRELVRLAEVADARDGLGDFRQAVIAVVRDEIEAFWTDVLTCTEQSQTGDRLVTESDKLATRQLLVPQLQASNEEVKPFLWTDLKHWTPAWASPGWHARYGEQWRSLLVRFGVAFVLLDNSTHDSLPRLYELQAAVTSAACSALVGLETLIACILNNSPESEESRSTSRETRVVASAIADSETVIDAGALARQETISGKEARRTLRRLCAMGILERKGTDPESYAFMGSTPLLDSTKLSAKTKRPLSS